MISKTPLNMWILRKISDFLKAKEGCEVQDTEYTANGARVYIKDSFGFRYEIQIKQTGRNFNGDDEEGNREADEFIGEQLEFDFKKAILRFR